MPVNSARGLNLSKITSVLGVQYTLTIVFSTPAVTKLSLTKILTLTKQRGMTCNYCLYVVKQRFGIHKFFGKFRHILRVPAAVPRAFAPSLLLLLPKVVL